MPQGKYQNPIVRRIEFVQRDIAGLATRDEQLAEPVGNRPTDERIAFQHGEPAEDKIEGCQRRGGFQLEEKLDQALQIGIGACGYDYFGHTLGLGFRVFRPCSLAR